MCALPIYPVDVGSVLQMSFEFVSFIAIPNLAWARPELFCLFFKQKTAYEMRISDCSSDVCSSDLLAARPDVDKIFARNDDSAALPLARSNATHLKSGSRLTRSRALIRSRRIKGISARRYRSEEHTSELQSLMRISYAVFCLKKKKKPTTK